MNETELNQFTLSIECLKLALRISHAINNETIDFSILRKGYRIDNPNGPIIPHEYELSKSDLYQDAQNLQVSALGTCILFLDKTLESFVKKNPSSEVNFDKIRSIIFQLRNAYAHNPLRPTWYCWTKYLRKYKIELSNKSILIDLSTLNGQEFDINQIGGFGNLFSMIEECKNFIAKNPKLDRNN